MVTPPVPSRRQTIADDLRHLISTGYFKPGERLPSEAQLATRYRVSTPTLRSALALLQGEGLVEKIHGSGNFVRRPLRRTTYVGGAATPPVPPPQATVRTTTLQAHGDLPTLLNVPPLTPVTEVLYVTHEGKTPNTLVRIYTPQALAPADTSGPERITASRADRHPPLSEVQERLGARLPTQEESTALRISASLPVLSLTRVATDTTGRVVEAALMLLPGDRSDALFTTRLTIDDGTSTE
ncbi:GntR family transcriptional regulator [Streptomyces vinaceus]|uniref:GntR family transcriptional regulator n=1 Tax=Streptomyces vinaceus TaxID=1960 RepID=UPI0037F9F461